VGIIGFDPTGPIVGTSSGGGSVSAAVTLQSAVPVAGVYMYNSTISNTTDTGVNTQIAYSLPAGMVFRAARLRFVNNSATTTGEVAGANPIVLRASVATAATGPWFPVSVAGNRTITLDTDCTVDTDPVALTFASTGKLYVKTYLTVTAGQTWPAHIPVGSGTVNMAYTSSGGTAETDLTQSTTQVVGTYNRPYAPAAILADYVPSTTPRVAVVGDSIAAGQGDTTRGGFILRALSAVLPYVRVAVDGARVQHFVDPNLGRRRLNVTRGCNVAITEFATNDIFTDARTLAQIQADSLTLWTALNGRGMKVFQTTLLPQSSTTDAYATLANQTTRTGNTTRVSFNNWVRAGAPINATTKVAVAVGTGGALLAGQTGHPLQSYFETADIAESSRDSGLWIVTGAANYATTDGTHPSAAVHALLAAAINTTTLTAAAA
jgi:lysophospholipase L1-like esterase